MNPNKGDILYGIFTSLMVLLFCTIISIRVGEPPNKPKCQCEQIKGE